jgi:hypothetical protein
MADGEQVVVAEADERSRWIVTCLTGCTGVLLFSIFWYMTFKYRDEDLLLLLPILPGFLGIHLIAVFVLLLVNRYVGNIGQRRRLVDELLML